MTFKEFKNWCNERACDGCWGMLTSLTCIDIMNRINKLRWWKRKKAWEEIENQVMEEIVNPINAKIKELSK